MAAERRAGNLPGETSRLVGRRTELQDVARLCGRSRLVTVTGVGGVGKTRLARRAAGELQPRFADGVWWVGLSPLTDGWEALPYAIAEALPLADQTTRPMLEVIAEYLAERQTLLVWDTCEHLVEECREVAATLLSVAPGLRILATSRRPLGLHIEDILALDPLPVPTADGMAAAADAVVLLADRAARAVPGFAVTDANRAELAALCRRLEGLPLALELAAARLRDLPVAELNQRLDDRYTILGSTEGEDLDADPPWHRALRTAIGWSHQLCTPAERLIWARLSVFAGTFDTEAARRVCADALVSGEQVPGLLQALVDKSILIWEPTGDAERYRMLDTIREYGAHWLRGLGEEATLRRRHRDHYLALARRGEAAWIGPHQFAWYDRMTAEHDNLRAALEYSLTERGGHVALELTGTLWFFWQECGFAKEGRHYLDQALAADIAPSPARVTALYACGLLLLYLGDLPALEERAAECAALAARFGDRERTYAASTALRTSALRGDLERTVAQAEALLPAGWREQPPTSVHLSALVLLTHSLVAAGRLEEAVVWLDELSAAGERSGERSMCAWGDFVRAQAELALGRLQEAHEHARAALRIKHRLRDGVGTAHALESLARSATGAGRHREAAWLLGLAARLWDSLGQPQAGIPAMVAAHEACERRTREALGADAYRDAFDAGGAVDEDTGIAYALDPAARSGPPPAQPFGGGQLAP
ncbi:ATP-binding protein [Streptomyces sp. G45]|uniref:ATP-binding protein n=1 Tax=Streptomyces sp. G45 TaxID=3406627 RepID=UPI003C1CE433